MCIVSRKVLVLYINYIVPNYDAFSALFRLLCVLAVKKKNVSSFCIYKTLGTGWFVKYMKSYCKYVFEEMKTPNQRSWNHTEAEFAFSLSSVTEWPLLCS